jgi:hypothetical protein
VRSKQLRQSWQLPWLLLLLLLQRSEQSWQQLQQQAQPSTVALLLLNPRLRLRGKQPWQQHLLHHFLLSSLAPPWSPLTP